MIDYGMEQLRTHMEIIRPIMSDFCAEHEFTFVNPQALGRYPRIRIERTEEIVIWFDLWMCLDPDGNRYGVFFEAIPYELSGGVHMIVLDEGPHGRFYSTAFLIWEKMPFHSVPPLLHDAMATNLPRLLEWNADRLRGEGEVVNLE